MIAIFCGGMVVGAQDSVKHDGLVVWVVHPAGSLMSSGYGSAARNAPGYGEQTTGSFGSSASNYGTAASNVGVPTDSPVISREAAVARAQAAHDHGAPVASATVREENAGDFGQSAGSAGTSVSNYGKAPSSVGQSAGSVGTDASNYGQSVGSLGSSVKAQEPAGGLVQLSATAFTATHPHLRVRFVTMGVDKVAAGLLADAKSPTQYPDVLVFENFPATWPGPSAELERAAAIHFGGNPLAQGNSSAPGALSSRVYVVLPRSQGRTEAEAFDEFLQNQGALKAPVTAR